MAPAKAISGPPPIACPCSQPVDYEKIKTLKQNIAAPLDLVAIADAVIHIYLDNAGDLEYCSSKEKLTLGCTSCGYCCKNEWS